MVCCARDAYLAGVPRRCVRRRCASPVNLTSVPRQCTSPPPPTGSPSASPTTSCAPKTLSPPRRACLFWRVRRGSGTGGNELGTIRLIEAAASRRVLERAAASSRARATLPASLSSLTAPHARGSFKTRPRRALRAPMLVRRKRPGLVPIRWPACTTAPTVTYGSLKTYSRAPSLTSTIGGNWFATTDRSQPRAVSGSRPRSRRRPLRRRRTIRYARG